MKLSRQTKKDMAGYVFILPNLIGVLLFTFIPIVYSLIISFTDWDFTKGFGNWNWVGFKNFLDIWKDKWFVDSLKNTIIFAVCVVLFTLVIAIILAVVIDRFCFAKTPIRLALFMPYISNVVAVAIVWVMMYSPWGPFTQFVKSMGVKNPPQWLGDYKWALPAVIIMTVWGGIGYAVMIYTSAIQGLPKDVYEAAEVDGAGEIIKFLKLTIPFLSPTTFFLIITTLISSFQVFAPIQLMTRGGPGSSSSVLVYYIYQSAFSFYKMGYASAMSWILFILLFIVTLIQWKNQKKWVSY
ncbi:carbohydrate ABC transporter permease [Anaerocolumna sp. MB42-C2]|uniref:carbohydrate ABC transporter permease n=1 Tax=Anaerocolumna sp. MB42-C2 TaxID=3070997 RepID=UPI0027E05081|nr:sugar ABC transporter permease [Anaerocolumna sp. MB42-C2]WMJ89977.1 sugar ABC transporter permease [Anaerocolumna sp. MB42-C2]